MATISLKAIGNFRTKIRHIQSGTEIFSDAPKDNNGKGEMFSPTDMLSASLAACMITIMDIASKEHGFSVEGTEINVTKIMGVNPRKVAEIVVELNFPIDKKFTDKAKRIIDHSSKNCPVALSLHPDIKQTIILNY